MRAPGDLHWALPWPRRARPEEAQTVRQVVSVPACGEGGWRGDVDGLVSCSKLQKHNETPLGGRHQLLYLRPAVLRAPA